MKINRIELKGYNQFEDVKIDLTYPKGHEKAGEPLDKVCIIGQSGTGKTSLLRLIKWFVSDDPSIAENIELPIPDEDSIVISFNLKGFNYYALSYHRTWDIAVCKDPGIRINDEKFIETYQSRRATIKPLLINYPAEMLYYGKLSNDELQKLKNEIEKQVYSDKIKPKQIIDFALEDVRKIFDYILNEIKSHRAQEIYHLKEIGVAVSENNTVKEELEIVFKEYKKWSNDNPNPLENLANKCLDPVLFSFGLKTKTKIDLNTIMNLGFIELQTLTDQDVPVDFWSTGTRQLVQTAVPLYQLKPKDAIILIDEPERSLYPDIQKSIIDTYVNLAPECQFFFATHSPIIASAFEPWEIVELKFDKNHQYVIRELYYEGEDHVDNYLYFPEYLRWDSILARIFDLEEEGGKKRLEALEEIAELKIRLRKLKEKNKLDTPQGKEMVRQFEVLSKKLDWRYQ